MNISRKDWDNYTTSQELIRKKASDLMQAWIDKNGVSDRNSMVKFAKALTDKYGETAGAYACQLFDEIAARAGINTSAIPADVATYDEVGKAVNGSLKQSGSGKLVPGVVERLTKQVAADTMLQNAKRYGAEWAWIPDGGSCVFCRTLASNGWQKLSNALRNNHADHIHANCNCEFAIRFNPNDNVAGYDPDKYLEEYNKYNGDLKAWRRELESITNEMKNNVLDVTEVYLNKANPGIGRLVFENGTTKEELRDRKTATWLHDNFGGNIKCLPEESEKGKNPDSLWNGKYWEFKQPTTKNAIDDRIKKGKKQITAAQSRNNKIGEKSGYVIDLSDSTIPIDEAIKAIEKSAKERLKNADVIIKNGNEFIKAIRIK